ncbi:hypothetical protein ACFLY5_00975 [Patescibacteria group bacterium]
MNLFLNKMNYGVQIRSTSSGQALMTAVFFFMVVSLIILAGLVTSTISGAQISRDLLISKKSYFLAEAGSDAIYRVTNGKNYSPTEVMVIDGFYATTTIADVSGDVVIESTADAMSKIRKVEVNLTNDTGVAFHYGVQVDEGGVYMQNSSMITGNLYSNGPVESDHNNEIYGDVVSAGPMGSISGVYATGTAYAHNIDDSEIEGDAYYQNISGSTVWGTLYPGSADQPFADMPITDEMIEEWEAIAEASVISAPCPYEIDSDTTIGPVKIACDLEITGDPEVTLGGNVWVEGDVLFKNTAVIKIDPALGKKSVAIIADNPSDQLTSSKITLSNSVTFEDSGTEGSYVVLVSQNNSAENGGSEKAISLANTVSGDLLMYAAHGLIYLNNKSDLTEVTGYEIHLANQANVLYETGLANLLFQSGPGGGFSLDTWRETE